jgi:D-amino peptidase
MMMRRGTRIDTIWLVPSILAAVLPCVGQPKKSVFVITDAEGVAGICRQEQTEPTDTELRQLLTGEVNAAVDGFLAGGADEVVVWDGHDSSRTLSATTIHNRAKLAIGNMGPLMTFDRGYAAVAFVGQHSKAGVRGGIMAHSYSSLGIQNMLLNGKPVGEIETLAALAGSFGIPVIFLSGDQAAARELHDIVPDAVTAEVKEGLARYSCNTLSAAAARDLIRERAAEAARKIGSIRPYRIAGPVTLQIEYTTRNSLPIGAGAEPGRELVDDRTIRIHGKDLVEAWTRYQGR